jgi:hypothetical protein
MTVAEQIEYTKQKDICSEEHDGCLSCPEWKRYKCEREYVGDGAKPGKAFIMPGYALGEGRPTAKAKDAHYGKKNEYEMPIHDEIKYLLRPTWELI